MTRIRTEADYACDEYYSVPGSSDYGNEEGFLAGYEVATTKLEKEITSLKKLIVEARPYVEHCEDLFVFYKNKQPIIEWNEKTKDIKVEA